MNEGISWDNAVEATSDDAALSKLSSINLNYYDDPFMQYLVGRSKPVRRSPLINRGYFARVQARNDVIDNFLSTCRNNSLPSQIIALGGGCDTLYFNLKSNGNEPNLFLDFDLPAVVQRKAKIIANEESLHSLIKTSPDEIKKTFSSYMEKQKEIKEEKNKEKRQQLRHEPHVYIDSCEYKLVSCDITKINHFLSFLQNSKVNFSNPTLFISECVLVYIEPEKSLPILKMISENFTCGFVFVYEQIRPDDAFGKVMTDNLMRRGCPLKGLVAHKTPEMQVQRFEEKAGFTKCYCRDMNDIYYKYLNRELVRKTEKVEIFDEFEEFHLMQAHYCIVLAANLRGEQKMVFDHFTLQNLENDESDTKQC
eukprot:maker-scaffold_6-snap-gene-18.48-mRNA-1 protein AED:0.02 eAED:0.02 QI:44/1/1/1/1/1/3/106/365